MSERYGHVAIHGLTDTRMHIKPDPSKPSISIQDWLQMIPTIWENFLGKNGRYIFVQVNHAINGQATAYFSWDRAHEVKAFMGSMLAEIGYMTEDTEHDFDNYFSRPCSVRHDMNYVGSGSFGRDTWSADLPQLPLMVILDKKQRPTRNRRKSKVPHGGVSYNFSSDICEALIPNDAPTTPLRGSNNAFANQTRDPTYNNVHKFQDPTPPIDEEDHMKDEAQQQRESIDALNNFDEPGIVPEEQDAVMNDNDSAQSDLTMEESDSDSVATNKSWAAVAKSPPNGGQMPAIPETHIGLLTNIQRSPTTGTGTMGRRSLESPLQGQHSFR